MRRIFNLSQNARAKENPIKPEVCVGHSARRRFSPSTRCNAGAVGQPRCCRGVPAPAIRTVVCLSIDQHILAHLILFGSVY